MKHAREELGMGLIEHEEKYNNYLKIKKLIEEIEVKYTLKHGGKGRDEQYHGPPLISYEEFKEKAKLKKDELPNKVKKIDFYHHLTP